MGNALITINLLRLGEAMKIAFVQCVFSLSSARLLVATFLEKRGAVEYICRRLEELQANDNGSTTPQNHDEAIDWPPH